jgi:cellobiose transport system permease protein
MFVVASRSSDAMGQVPPPVTPGGNLGANIARLFDNTDAYFLTGLINSAIVATTVTVSVVFFSTLAGFFAKLPGTQRAAGDHRDDDGPTRSASSALLR